MAYAHNGYGEVSVIIRAYMGLSTKSWWQVILSGVRCWGMIVLWDFTRLEANAILMSIVWSVAGRACGSLILPPKEL
jgi:hypothetical protein